MSEEPRFIVGIDLGTTNCALAYVDTQAPEAAEGAPDAPPIQVFSVPQLVHAGSVEPRDTLPSFLYLPGEHELAEGALALPWDDAPADAVGAFARDQGARLPGRLIASAKSWLCHRAADRRGPILPWQADDDVDKRSPVDAAARYLGHLRSAWDAAHPEHPLAEQELLITVPASFDAAARELTVEAAQAAGLDAPRLLEEPQAAFYAWLDAAGDGWREQVGVGDLVLVCDIGGGTTDLSLVAVSEEDGSLELTRLAVGDHLLVGGDNMDLALARTLEARLADDGKALDDWQLQALWHGCREAKETLLSGDGDSVALTIPGRGSKLIGGAIKVELQRDDLDAVLVDGFLPRCAAVDRPARRTAGFVEMGLPYEADPGVTRHLAAFLGKQKDAAPEPGDGWTFAHPAAVLFNGGVFAAEPLRQRILDVLGDWTGAEGGAPPRELVGAALDVAVARGAAYYGLARRGRGVRIRGGTARAYYIGVESAMPAVPGLPTPVKGVCVAPFGMEEGTSEALEGRQFGLLVGEPVSFRFFCSTTRRDDQTGDLVARVADLEELEPVEVTLDTAKGAEPGQPLPVELESVLTELGTLELWSKAVEGDGRWKLEYEVRESERAD